MECSTLTLCSARMQLMRYTLVDCIKRCSVRRLDPVWGAHTHTHTHTDPQTHGMKCARRSRAHRRLACAQGRLLGWDAWSDGRPEATAAGAPLCDSLSLFSSSFPYLLILSHSLRTAGPSFKLFVCRAWKRHHGVPLSQQSLFRTCRPANQKK